MLGDSIDDLLKFLLRLLAVLDVNHGAIPGGLPQVSALLSAHLNMRTDPIEQFEGLRASVRLRASMRTQRLRFMTDQYSQMNPSRLSIFA
jgi:hypothetical protein